MTYRNYNQNLNYVWHWPQLHFIISKWNYCIYSIMSNIWFFKIWKYLYFTSVFKRHFCWVWKSQLKFFFFPICFLCLETNMRRRIFKYSQELSCTGLINLRYTQVRPALKIQHCCSLGLLTFILSVFEFSARKVLDLGFTFLFCLSRDSDANHCENG